MRHRDVADPSTGCRRGISPSSGRMRPFAIHKGRFSFQIWFNWWFGLQPAIGSDWATGRGREGCHQHSGGRQGNWHGHAARQTGAVQVRACGRSGQKQAQHAGGHRGGVGRGNETTARTNRLRPGRVAPKTPKRIKSPFRYFVPARHDAGTGFFLRSTGSEPFITSLPAYRYARKGTAGKQLKGS